jgi:hypothetical protein
MRDEKRHPLVGGPTLRTTWHGDTPVSIEAVAHVDDVVAIVAPNHDGPDDIVCLGVVTEVSDDGEALRARVDGGPDWSRESARNAQVLIVRGVDPDALVIALRARAHGPRGGSYFASLADLRRFVRQHTGSAR